MHQLIEKWESKLRFYENCRNELRDTETDCFTKEWLKKIESLETTILLCNEFIADLKADDSNN